MEFCLAHRETFLAIHVQQWIHHRHFIKEFFTLGIKVLPAGTPCDTVQGDQQIRGTIPLPSFARSPSTRNSFLPAEGPQNYMADQQRLQISELHFGKLHLTFNVFMLEDKIQDPRKFLFRVFSRRQCYGSKKWRWSSRWTDKSRRSQFQVILISRILRCWTRGLRLL